MCVALSKDRSTVCVLQCLKVDSMCAAVSNGRQYVWLQCLNNNNNNNNNDLYLSTIGF